MIFSFNGLILYLELTETNKSTFESNIGKKRIIEPKVFACPGYFPVNLIVSHLNDIIPHFYIYQNQ